MMKIAMISSEIVPFAKTGGLADVVGTLSIALERRGHELILIMPAYRAVLQGGFALEETDIRLSVQVSDRREVAEVLRARMGNNIAVYCVRADHYFDRDFLYGLPAGDFPDNAERFTFFSRAALELLRLLSVDVLHCHDWQTALAIVFLKAQPERYTELRGVKSVFTVHNLGFQGIFPATDWQLLNLGSSFFTPQFMEFYGNINFIKGALLFADKITTVSPSYAQEIMETEQGFGLEGVLHDRRQDIAGILNGVDYSEWNPESDPYIAKHYSADGLAEKRSCKKALQRIVGLPQKTNQPVLGMISRLTAQKGLDLIEQILEPLMQCELQMAILASGERRYEELLLQAAQRFPEKIAVLIGFDNVLAHQIEAGADIFLMPSLYEPCGLNQMFSLKYGTIPVVRAVGGLKDTVADYDAERGSGTGFVFGPYEPQALVGAIDRALQTYKNKRVWTALRRRAMKKDFSWDRSAEAYCSLYEQLLR
jgi:starch synthase